MSNLALVALAAVVLGVGAFLVVAANSGYDSRRHVNEAIAEAAPFRARIVEFYERNKALPRAADAPMLRQDQRLRRARSVEWNADTGMLVIAMDGHRYPGKRFAFVAEIRDGRLEWGCRPIDIESKYLPASCR
jgi:hypothetical protein